jgi:hypothetical protein
MNKWKIHKDIWFCFEHVLSHFFHHPRKDDSSRLNPPLGPSLRANHAILNNAAATQSHIGWSNFLKGRLSNEWAKLWIKYMGLPMAKACERALIQALLDHIYRLWSVHNTEDHKNDNRAVSQYKQQALHINIAQQYSVFQTRNLPLNLLQQSHFDIPQEELLLLSYDIRHAWLRSEDLYISRATAHDLLARVSHAQHILHFTSGRRPYTSALLFYPLRTTTFPFPPFSKPISTYNANTGLNS